MEQATMTNTTNIKNEALKRIENATKGAVTFVHVSELYELAELIKKLEN